MTFWDTFTRKPGGEFDSSVAALDPLGIDTGIPGVELFRASSGYGVEYPGMVAIGFEGDALAGLDAPGYLVGTRTEVDAFLANLRSSAGDVSTLQGAREAIADAQARSSEGLGGAALGMAAFLGLLLLARR